MLIIQMDLNYGWTVSGCCLRLSLVCMWTFVELEGICGTGNPLAGRKRQFDSPVQLVSNS